MRRRDFITLLGRGAATWPLSARAQQSTMPIVGFVSGRSADTSVREVAALRKGFNESGYFEGQNATIEYHWLEGQYDRLPSLMADFVRRRVAVIATLGSNPGALAAKAATTTIPIVFSVGEDAVKMGLVTSLARPGGNATGVNFLDAEIAAKRLALLHEPVPKAVRIAVLVNPANASTAEATLRQVPETDALSDCKLRSSRPVPAVKSRRSSQLSRATGPTHSSSPPMRSSSAVASSLRRSRRTMGFPRLIPLATMLEPAD